MKAAKCFPSRPTAFPYLHLCNLILTVDLDVCLHVFASFICIYLADLHADRILTMPWLKFGNNYGYYCLKSFTPQLIMSVM